MGMFNLFEFASKICSPPSEKYDIYQANGTIITLCLQKHNATL